MNQLTKFLVDGILNEAESDVVTALFAGGFKPPTKGHLEVVLKAIKENPEIDQIYIVVGSGVRNGISQSQSIKIWEKYKKFIPKSTEIVESGSPIAWVKDYLKDHTEDKTYVLIGAREGDIEDEKDVEQRSNLFQKYGGEIKPIYTVGGISGTKARAAAKQSKEAFYQFLPDQLSTQDKEEIYNIILPTLNEVGEGSSKPYKWEKDFDEYVFTTDNNIGYIVSLSEMSEGDKMGIAVEFLAKTPEMDGYSSKIEVGKGELFRVMATIIDIIKSHLSKDPEIEFILYSPSKKTGEGDIGNQRDKLYKIFLQKQIPGIRIRDIGTSAVIAYLPKRDELNLEINKPEEGNAAPYGSGYNKVDEKKDPKKGTGKKSNRLNENALFNLDIPKFNQPKTIQQYLIENINEINLSKENAVDINGDLTGGTFKVGDIVYEYSIKNISNPYKDLGLFYNIQFTPRGEVTSIPKGGKENYIKILSTMYKIIVDFIEKEKPEYLGISSLDNNKNYHTVYNRLTDNPSNLIPGYFRKDSNLKFNSPQGEGRFIVLKRKKNLNENASYSKDIDVKGKILELTKHMLAKGMNITPLPKVIFKNGDSSNAREFLGKTAYYNPESQTIVLYTEGRHPKDIVRSFAHEMIHHIQNLEGRLGNITTTNTQEDDYLNDIEAEANLKGTMTFRNWTDSLNENLTKNSNYLYHWTSYSACKKIIESNKLKSNESNQFFEYDESRDLPDYKNVVFFTIEDERFADEENSNQCILVVDKSKLSKDYKVISYDDSYEETVVYTNDPSIPVLPYLKGVVLMNTLQKSTVKKMVEFLESKGIPYEINDNLEKEVKAKQAKLPTLKKELINKLKSKYPNGFIGYLNTPLISRQTPEYFKDNPTYSYPNITINKLGEYGEKNKFQVKFKIEPQNLEKYINWFMYSPDSIEDLINMDNYEGEELYLKGDIPIDLTTLQEANLKSTMTFRNWTDSLNENKQINYTNPNFNTEWEEAIRYPEFKEMGKDGWLKIANQGKPVSYSSIKDKLGNVDLDFEGLEEPKKQRFLDAFKKGTIEMPIAVKFSDNDYDLVAGNTRLSGLVKNGEDPKIWIVNIGSINEYDNSGPTTPKVYIVKDDGTYKEAPIKLLSKISNLTYDMGGGETNYYPEKNIVIVDNIPVEEFAKEPGDIKGEKVYVEYNLNNPTSLPKANKIIASQLVYHLDNREAFAQTVANSLKDGGTFEFQSDLMNKKDKMFLQHLSDEYGFGLPTKLNQYKQESLPLKKGEFVEPIISYIYKITDKDGKTATLSTTKKGKWWEYEKIDGDLDFKTGKFSTPPISPDPDFRDKKYTLRTFDKYLSFFGDSNTIVDFEELNEANKPYKHKHGFDDKLGKDPFGLNQFAREIAEEVISEGRYDTLANKLSSIAFGAFKDIHDRGDKEGSFKFRVDNPDDEHDIPSEDFYFDFEGVVEITDGEYGVDGGANAGFDTDGNEITPLLSVKFKIPKNPSNTYPTWQDISFDIKDVIRHELEHLTQDGDNEKPGKYIEDDQLIRDLIDAKLLPKAQYFKLEKEIDAMLQGLYFKAKKLKRPYKKVIDDYLATQSITQEEKNDILKIWRSRAKSLSLPLFENESISDLYTIYLDLDGVIADFDKRFTELAGMGPREYEDSFGREKFWDFIDIKHKIKFFSKMDWMPEGKKLYNFIKQFDHKLLSAPSKNDASKVGKRIWAKENTPETQLILSPAYNKKNYADKSNILIDDRESNIQQWKDAGGIGILFKSTDQVIDELKKIMNL